jgi:hypothetical protein
MKGDVIMGDTYLDRLQKALDKANSDLSYKAPEMGSDPEMFEILKERYIQYLKDC